MPSPHKARDLGSSPRGPTTFKMENFMYYLVAAISILISLSFVFFISITKTRWGSIDTVWIGRPRSKDEMVPGWMILSGVILSIVPILQYLPIVVAFFVILVAVLRYVGEIFFNFVKYILGIK